jgi:hypothetical protein
MGRKEKEMPVGENGEKAPNAKMTKKEKKAEQKKNKQSNKKAGKR